MARARPARAVLTRGGGARGVSVFGVCPGVRRTAGSARPAGVSFDGLRLPGPSVAASERRRPDHPALAEDEEPVDAVCGLTAKP
ncbi:hypothetical protein [Streptomyces marincola]|uniref:Uncharacterized protein n=1 Tax=Streptomyces marincola TaxID=2878388 RepID=A0A1W7D4E6_9ACTN|nr:hypothetical protein [Streptomyces marincola]ARQ71807.1 hypothetical protein CAG99_25890 [Streptomyces marincola]